MAELRAFVCGHPIGHSRSPHIHGFWLARHGIEASYSPVDVPPDAFPAFLGALAANGFVGGNITLPYKKTAHDLVARRNSAAEMIGAVNTVWFENGRLCGGNTDAYGYGAHLDACVPAWRDGERALVLGAGGAARAIVHALQQAGYRDIHVANRTSIRAVELAQRFGAAVRAHSWSELDALMASADLLVNTSALGMTGKPRLVIDIDRLPDHAIVSDIVYAPLKTELLAKAEQRGLKAVDGLGMLLHQAVPGFERWFGQRPVVDDALRRHIMSDLDKQT